MSSGKPISERVFVSQQQNTWNHPTGGCTGSQIEVAGRGGLREVGRGDEKPPAVGGPWVRDLNEGKRTHKGAAWMVIRTKP